MDQVVLDTNILVAALRSRRGASFQLFALLGTGRFKSCVSVPLVLEYEAVLREHASALGLKGCDVDTLLNYVVSVSHHQEIFFLWRPRLRDPKDDMVLEVAVASEASHLVTHNVRDFADAARFGLSVVTPGRYLRELGDIQ
ncbi:MAG: putative toxin-antitoxin system toxin component, PIN family [Gammaproteobacteria bacterium]|nr:putative toxin-antitoxin system toxin component, PIN family [Gammaproteobacteria bacterium]